MSGIPRVNLYVSEELHRLIEEHAKRAGMSVPAYVREAVARAAGWDLAMAMFAKEIAELRAEVEQLKAERPA